jgi:hypothetical protein
MESYYTVSVFRFSDKGKGKDKSTPMHNYAPSYKGKRGVDI